MEKVEALAVDGPRRPELSGQGEERRVERNDRTALGRKGERVMASPTSSRVGKHGEVERRVGVQQGRNQPAEVSAYPGKAVRERPCVYRDFHCSALRFIPQV